MEKRRLKAVAPWSDHAGGSAFGPPHAKTVKTVLSVTLCAIAPIGGSLLAFWFSWTFLAAEACPLNVIMWATTAASPVAGVATAYVLGRYVLRVKLPIVLFILAVPILATVVFADFWFLAPWLEGIVLPWFLSMAVVILCCEWLLLSRLLEYLRGQDLRPEDND